MTGVNPEVVLHSELQDEPDMLPLIEHFVCRLIDKADRMLELLKSRRFDEIAQLAHQLKGAGGGYGYPTLSEAARAVEFAAKQDPQIENLLHLIGELSELCQQATRGLRANACEVDFFS